MTALSNPIKRIVVMCALRHKDKYLLLLRNKNPHKGKLSPVGGKLEACESPRQAVLREVYEETGIQLKNEELYLAGILTETSPSDYNWILYVYYAEIDFLTPGLCDEGELMWVNPFEVESDLIPDSDFYFYQAIVAQRFFVLDALYDKDETLIQMIEEVSGKVVFPIQ